MRRLIHFVTAIAFAILLGGCATTKPLPEAARSSIDLVSISDSVAVAPTRYSKFGPVVSVHYNPVFIGVGGSFLTPGSGAAYDAILASERDENKQYALFLKAVGIDVSPIVRSEFELQIRQHPFFGPRLAQTAKYRFELDIPHYSLVQTKSFSEYYKASITVHARLVGQTGEVIAEAKGSSCLFLDCFSPNKLSDILAKPELLREQYTLATRYAIQELLKSL
jgi:hypothetical protein